MNRLRILRMFLLLMLVSAARARAQNAEPSQDLALAKQLSNPVSSLTSVPFQFNWENGVGDFNELRYVLNIQPVVPFPLSDRWNVITRWIMPYVSQPSLGAGIPPSSGWGDITASAFFSPVSSGSTTWGLGPVVVLPTTTDPLIGSGKWSAGPTLVVLQQRGPWTYGLLANQVWSFAGTGDIDRDQVSQGFFQPFLAYATKTGVTYTIQSESVANWLAAKASDTWTVPINAGFTKITRFGSFPFSVGLFAGVYVQSPSGGPEWKLRMPFTIILPKSKA